MKIALILFILTALLFGCNQQEPVNAINPVDWGKRMAAMPAAKNALVGQTYLSVYSEIYAYSERQRFSLTATISMRNSNSKDTVYVNSATYYDTHGEEIRHYFDQPIYLMPMETVEIVINDSDMAGGTGGNFIFEWATDSTLNMPIFEAVMISMSGQQGLSFLTQGIVLK